MVNPSEKDARVHHPCWTCIGIAFTEGFLFACIIACVLFGTGVFNG